jgi:hypothetical protein
MEILANGFTVVTRVTLGNNESIVLAENKGREEFATWMEGGNNTFWGHYFPYYWPEQTREGAESEAIRDFNDRVGRGF